MYEHETRLASQGYQIIAGIDEAGRGPLAGPVVAAAVILPFDIRIEGINDSKKLSEKKRTCLYRDICAYAIVGVGIINEKIIDEVNIYQAARMAMREAVLDLNKKPDYLLIDGPMSIDLEIEAIGIVGGDRLSASIAAASIVAKVTRDTLMMGLHEKYPHYGLDRHKGYPTKEHIALLEEHGISPIHRQSFGPVKKLLQA